MLNRKGFTMVELLVVLVIIAILAAVATPLFLSNTQRAKASEASATMALLRQALREFRIQNGNFFDILHGCQTPLSCINLVGTPRRYFMPLDGILK